MRVLFSKNKFLIVIFVWCLSFSSIHVQAATYDFEADTLAATPANVTVTAGTFEVQNQVTLGKSLTAVTQLGVIAGLTFNNFTGSADQSVVWKQAYSNNMGRSGFTLRAQAADTSVSVGAKQGYLFHVYDSNSVYIWKVGPSSYTPLWSGSLAKIEPRWFKAVVVGNQQGFYYSNDGTSYTLLASTTDATYATGTVQYTAGYGAAVSRDYVDDIVITNLDFDGTAPIISSVTPLDNATNTSRTSNLVATFSEAVNVNVGNVSIYKTSDDSLVEVTNITSGQVTGGGTNSITVNPITTLDELTEYYILIDTNSVRDIAGNNFAGIVSSSTWNFTTGDFTNPTILTFSPADNATGVSLSSDLTITFSENITVGTGTISIYKSSDNSLVESVDITSGQITGGGTNSITINPTADFEHGTGYYVHVATTTLSDSVGNLFAGIGDNTTFSFTTLVQNIPVVVVQQSRVSGSSVVEQVEYLIKNGNTTVAEEVMQKYPTLFIVQTTSAPSAKCSAENTSRVLRSGASGEDVRSLQKFLNCVGFDIARSGPGSKYNETIKFGSGTKIALAKFQKQNGIKPASGVFGPITRKFIENMQK